MMDCFPEISRDVIDTLSRELGGPDACSSSRIEKISGGRNNRGYCLQFGQRRYFLKEYFPQGKGPSERLLREWNFLKFAHSRNLWGVANPILRLDQENIGVFEFLEGKAFSGTVADPRTVGKAIQWMADLNSDLEDWNWKQLSTARDACLGIEGHIKLLEDRMQQFQRRIELDPNPEDLVRFVLDQWIPACEARIKDFEVRKINIGMETMREILSPSDFGFHNCIVRPDGRLCFIDFEYAGRDGIEKWICDFFCQPRIPVPVVHLQEVVSAFASSQVMRKALVERIRLLFPIVALKWCGIVLNEFIADTLPRRYFSLGKRNPVDLEGQLDLAQMMLSKTFHSSFNGLH